MRQTAVSWISGIMLGAGLIVPAFAQRGTAVTLAPAPKLIGEQSSDSANRNIVTTAFYRPDSLMSSVGNLRFPTDSAMAKVVARSCAPNELCRLIAEVTGSGTNETITKVVHVERAPRFDTPERLVEYIYRHEQGDRFALHEAAWRSVFSPHTVQVLSAVYVKHNSGDLDEPFEPHPWSSPETQPMNVSVTYIATRPQSVTALILHDNRDDPTNRKSKLRYKLVETPQGWRVDDVEWSVNGKRNSFLSGLKVQAR